MKLLMCTTAMAGLLPLVAAAASNPKSGVQDVALKDTNRQLQDFGLDPFSFQFAGIAITTDAAMENCPSQWQGLVQCLIVDCPAFFEVCPYLGEDNDFNVDVDPTGACEAVEESMCNQFQGEDCCLMECTAQIMEVGNCLSPYAANECEADCSAVAESGGGGSSTTTDNATEAAGPLPMGGSEEQPVPTENTTAAEYGSPPPLIGFVEGWNEQPTGTFNFEVLQFGEFGVNDLLMECPDEWQAWVACVISDCSNFMDTCTFDKAGVTAYSNGFMEPICEDLTNDICLFISGEDCCLGECLVQTQQMTTCLHNAKSDLDFTTCDDVNCAIEDVTAAEDASQPPLISFSGESDLGPSIQFGEFDTDDVKEECPQQWQAFIACAIADCPNYMEVCPIGDAVGAVASRNSFVEPTCEALTASVCQFVAGEDCCLADCLPQAQQITACIHDAKSGLDLTACADVTCALDGLGEQEVVLSAQQDPGDTTASKSGPLDSSVSKPNSEVEDNAVEAVAGSDVSGTEFALGGHCPVACFALAMVLLF